MVYVPIRKSVVKSDFNSNPGKQTPYKRKKAAFVYMGQTANHRPVVLIQSTHKGSSPKEISSGRQHFSKIKIVRNT